MGIGITSVSAVAMAAYIGLTATTIYQMLTLIIVTAIVAFTVAIVMSGLTQKYIENESQKKMFMELEGQKGTENVRSEIDSVEVESLHRNCLSGA